MEYMIHENLKSGGRFTYAKGHDQELIVTIMSLKCSIGNVFFLHMYLLVAIIDIKFGKVLSTTKFIQKVINTGMENLSLIVILLKGWYWRIIGVGMLKTTWCCREYRLEVRMYRGYLNN
jgi:hypothetical protein